MQYLERSFSWTEANEYECETTELLERLQAGKLRVRSMSTFAPSGSHPEVNGHLEASRISKVLEEREAIRGRVAEEETTCGICGGPSWPDASLIVQPKDWAGDLSARDNLYAVHSECKYPRRPHTEEARRYARLQERFVLEVKEKRRIEL